MHIRMAFIQQNFGYHADQMPHIVAPDLITLVADALFLLRTRVEQQARRFQTAGAQDDIARRNAGSLFASELDLFDRLVFIVQDDIGAGRVDENPDVGMFFQFVAIFFAEIRRQTPALQQGGFYIAILKAGDQRRNASLFRIKNGRPGMTPLQRFRVIARNFVIFNGPAAVVDVVALLKIYGVEGYAASTPGTGRPAQLTLAQFIQRMIAVAH